MLIDLNPRTGEVGVFYSTPKLLTQAEFDALPTIERDHKATVGQTWKTKTGTLNPDGTPTEHGAWWYGHCTSVSGEYGPRVDWQPIELVKEIPEWLL